MSTFTLFQTIVEVSKQEFYSKTTLGASLLYHYQAKLPKCGFFAKFIDLLRERKLVTLPTMKIHVNNYVFEDLMNELVNDRWIQKFIYKCTGELFLLSPPESVVYAKIMDETIPRSTSGIVDRSKVYFSRFLDRKTSSRLQNILAETTNLPLFNGVYEYKPDFHLPTLIKEYVKANQGFYRYTVRYNKELKIHKIHNPPSNNEKNVVRVTENDVMRYLLETIEIKDLYEIEVNAMLKRKEKSITLLKYVVCVWIVILIFTPYIRTFFMAIANIVAFISFLVYFQP